MVWKCWGGSLRWVVWGDYIGCLEFGELGLGWEGSWEYELKVDFIYSLKVSSVLGFYFIKFLKLKGFLEII